MFRNQAFGNQTQSQQGQIKMQMLQSNIIRVISQNKKLQHLLDYRQYFPRLKEFCMQVSSNWTKVNALIASINELDVEMKTQRQEMHNNVNHYYEHINKNIVQQIKDYKISINKHQEKIVDLKNKQKLRIKKNFQKIKVKWSSHIKRIETQIMDVLLQSQKQFIEKVDKSLIPLIYNRVIEEFSINDQKSRMELAHIQNLLSFHKTLNSNKKLISQESFQMTQQSQSDAIAIQKNTQQTFELNVDLMERNMKSMEFKLKTVLSEINWLQNKRRKMKKLPTKQSEQSNSNLEEFTQNFKLLQIKIQLEDTQSQLMGLVKFCDEMALQRQMKTLAQNQIYEQDDQPLLPERHEKKLMTTQQRLRQIGYKIKQYDQFYKNFNV